MSRRQHFLPFGPPRSGPPPPEWRLSHGCELPCPPPPPDHWPSDPPPFKSWPPCPPLLRSWPPDPPPPANWPQCPPPPEKWPRWPKGSPLSESWPPGPPLPSSWSPGPSLFESWPSSPPSPESWPTSSQPSRSWPSDPPSQRNWPPSPPSTESLSTGFPPSGSWPPGLPPLESWPQGPPLSGSWPPGPLPPGNSPRVPQLPRSWSPGPPPPESWPPGPPPPGSWPPGPPPPGSWPPGPPPPGSWFPGATPASFMPPDSLYGPSPPDFIPSLFNHGSNDGTKPGGLDEVKPPTKLVRNLDDKEKRSTESNENDKTTSPTKHVISVHMKRPTIIGDFGNSRTSPEIRNPSEPASNLDDKAKPSTKPDGIYETKSLIKPDGSDEVKPLINPGSFGTSKTLPANIDLPKPVSNPYEKEKISNKLGRNDETKQGMYDEMKPLTKPGGFDNSGTPPSNIDPSKPDDKEKSLTNPDGNGKTEFPTIHGGSNEVKPPTKPGGFGTSGTPPANIDLSELASKSDDKEKLLTELGGNDKPNHSGFDEVIPPTKPGNYDNSGIPLTNKDPPKSAPKPDGTEKSLTNPNGNDITKSITIHGGSDEVKPPTEPDSKDETKSPTKPGANDETKKSRWFMMSYSTQRKESYGINADKVQIKD